MINLTPPDHRDITARAALLTALVAAAVTIAASTLWILR